ncbi:Embryogenesis transmembrane protein-like [Zea mays]|uniref:Embryogenesis transmembrane protein-like n=1 Tax=Zea mays TaxID=4577 RepID=A0A1D6K7H5_MAIZE|nr:Embryogenesis transmembrane protein-like [Zea mays]
MVLDLFSLMGAYAAYDAGTCRAVKSSIYIWVLVLSVFTYIMIHILVFMRVVPRFVSEKRFVPKRLKDVARSMERWILSRCGVHRSQKNSSHKKDLEEARKFTLVLVTFAATVAYQAGLSPPGSFWAENDENKTPATSMLRSGNLPRYNTFVVCNSTSFIASLVTIILLLSPELSRHGIKSRAVTVCVVVNILGLVGAYAAGSCRSVVTFVSAVLVAVLVWIFFAVLAGIFVNRSVAEWFGKKIKPYIMRCTDRFGRVFSSNHGRKRSRNPEGENSIASHQQTEESIKDIEEGECPGEQQSPGKQQPTNIMVVSISEHASVNEKQAENSSSVMCKLGSQSTDPNSAANEAMTETETENIQDANMEEQQSSLVDGLKTPTTVADQESTAVECLSDIAPNNNCNLWERGDGNHKPFVRGEP